MTPEQGRNALNAFLEIREKLAAQEESRRVLVKEAEFQSDVIFWLFLLTMLGIILQLVWIVIKVIIDHRQERRVKILTDVAAGHGEETDRSKRAIVERGRAITVDSARVASVAREAAVKAEETASRLQETTAREIHEVRERLDAVEQQVGALSANVTRLVNKLCPDDAGRRGNTGG